MDERREYLREHDLLDDEMEDNFYEWNSERSHTYFNVFNKLLW